ncbi:hypothetical protein QMK19_03350 [Streptomyces sp. H10-C2]|uniref:hypothetical protein n=1 Tax=unclassified Streptomyces TaxID=2593676 RepID=UPI0024B8CE14|nr:MULTISPECIES: hypothetical protein [unclassified Streptomyces]MDJ0342222.1 hypothetical protein [Streptomyces sp. PH10-H1]MDJ0368736.1 hypothetical protein [Streptomyces sp. H10-C2]
MTGVTPAQLANLVDRAARHLTADEGALLRAGFAALDSARRSAGGLTEENRRLKGEVLALRRRAEPAEAAVAAVSVQGHVWAALVPPGGWASGPLEEVAANVGRFLIELMARSGSQGPAEGLGAPEPRATGVRPPRANVAASGGSHG